MVRDNLTDVIKALEEIGENLVNCFSNNEMKLNTNKMFKVNNRNTRTRCEICSKLTIKIPERRHWQVDAGWNTTKTGDLHINSLSEKLLGITFDCK